MSEPPPAGPYWQPAQPEQPEQVSLHKDAVPAAEPPLDFDPYRFGAPEHPVPPEYAPPGYRPPAVAPIPPAPDPAAYGGYPGYQQYPGYPPQGLPYGAPPPPYGTQYPPPRTGNGKAVAALVFGIMSIVFCWLAILDAIPVVLALVFGLLARGEARRRPGREGHGLAVAGIVCAIAGAVLAVVLTVWLYSRFSDCFNYSSGSAAYSQCVRNHL